jgi:hypothetical protein
MNVSSRLEARVFDLVGTCGSNGMNKRVDGGAEGRVEGGEDSGVDTVG